MTEQNSVTIYQNGVGSFERLVKVKANEHKRIALMFKTDYIGDVVGSIDIKGPVKVTELPNYSPNKEKPTLDLGDKDVMRQVVSKLKGAKITLKSAAEEVSGVNMGVENDEVDHGNFKTCQTYFCVMTKGGIRRLLQSNVNEVYFEDEDIRREIAKSLEYCLEQTKPNSSPVHLTLNSSKDALAAIRYIVPTPAWKSSYRLRQTTDGFELDGLAIVDNDSDEDWTNYNVAVVSGKPMTFSTDLAKIRIPKRSHVNFVEDVAQKAVEVDRGFEPKRLKSTVAHACCASPTPPNDMAGGIEDQCADKVAVEPQEVGDFSIFRSPSPVTVQAHKSVVVPLFSVKLKEAQLVLHYKRENNADKCMRAVKLRNEATYTLSRGKCEVYKANEWQGSCIFSTAKPGELAMLPHAVETGVSVLYEGKPVENITRQIRISDGVASLEIANTCKTVYTIKNVKDEPFTVLIDHNSLLNPSELSCSTNSKYVEKIKGGGRFTVEVPAKKTIEMYVVETHLEAQHIAFKDTSWLIKNIISVKNPLAQNETVQECIGIQESIDATERRINDVKAMTATIKEEQKRLRENITSMAGHGPDLDIWKTRLASSERELSVAEKETMPGLVQEKATLQTRLQRILRKITASWVQ